MGDRTVSVQLLHLWIKIGYLVLAAPSTDISCFVALITISASDNPGLA